MKFRIGMPPEVQPELRDPVRLVTDYNRVHLWAHVVAGVIVAPPVFAAWVALRGRTLIDDVLGQPPGPFLGTLVGLLVVHELVHMLTHPKMGFTKWTFSGYLPKQLLCYATYNGLQTRTRLLVTLAAPIVVLSVLPYVLSFYVPEAWIPLLAEISVINALLASGDVFVIGRVLREIPRTAMVHGEYYGEPL